MKIHLKHVEDQVIVITGASSGIGLATALAAAKRGGKVVLAARSGQALQTIVDQIKRSGGKAIAVPCDVGNRNQVDQLADAAIDTFGRIDTWINNAGTSIYGRLDEVSEGDSRKLFDTNFWGVVNGSLAALPFLRQHGGALINVGSEVSEAVVPLLGMYSATKHAVKGFTDALRIEIEEISRDPVSITLIQPTAVNTPFPQHAKNYLPNEPTLPKPMIEPEDVASAILEAAERPIRYKKVGAMSKFNTAVSKFVPGMADKMSAKQAKNLVSKEAPRTRDGALYEPSETTPLVGVTHGLARSLD